VLHVDRGDDADAGIEQGVDVLPALLVGHAGDVGVREFVDQREVGASCDQSLEIEFGEGRAAVVDVAAREDLHALEHRLRVRAVMRFDEAHHDIGAAFVASAALVEHREGLADTRCGAQIDPQRATRHDRGHPLFLHER